MNIILGDNALLIKDKKEHLGFENPPVTHYCKIAFYADILLNMCLVKV